MNWMCQRSTVSVEILCIEREWEESMLLRGYKTIFVFIPILWLPKNAHHFFLSCSKFHFGVNSVEAIEWVLPN